MNQIINQNWEIIKIPNSSYNLIKNKKKESQYTPSVPLRAWSSRPEIANAAWAISNGEVGGSFASKVDSLS